MILEFLERSQRRTLERRQHLQQVVLAKYIVGCKRMEIDPYPLPCTKLNYHRGQVVNEPGPRMRGEEFPRKRNYHEATNPMTYNSCLLLRCTGAIVAHIVWK